MYKAVGKPACRTQPNVTALQPKIGRNVPD